MSDATADTAAITPPANAAPPPTAGPPDGTKATEEWKPPTKAEWDAMQLESRRAAREAREAKAKLTSLDAKERDAAKEREARQAEERELEELKSKDPRAWLARRAGEAPEEFAKRLAGKRAGPEDELRKRLDEQAAKLEAFERAQLEREQTAKQRETETYQANAFRAVSEAATGDLELAAEVLKANPAAGKAWVAGWIDKEWNAYAVEHGLDAGSAAAAAKACAEVICEKELARIERLKQYPNIAKRLGFAQSQQPPASQGNQPPTLTRDLTGSRSAAPANTAGGSPPTEAELRRRAIAKANELQAERDAARSRG